MRLGGPKARRNFADPREGGDVFMYHDASTAVLLDLRRRFTAVGDVLLHALIRDGVTLARSPELTVQWDGILGWFFILLCRILIWLGVVVLGVGCRLLMAFIVGYRTLFMDLLCIAGRRAIRWWHPYKWLEPDLVHPALFLSVCLIFLLVDLGSF